MAMVATAQAIFIGICLYVYLRGWTRDFHVPLGFASDSLVALLQSKGTVDNGWWWYNPMVGAPLGFDALAFPTNSNVDQAIVWIVSRFVPHAAAAINLAWMAIVVLGGLSATWCLRQLGASTASALVAGTLFAVSPYALFRNIDHFWMVIYLVPFASTAALLLAAGRLERWRQHRWQLLMLGGCALLGFNYVYYAFFACFFLVVASIVGYVEARRLRVLVAGAVGIVVIGGATFLNLAPSLRSWERNGRPLILREKVPLESEQYGLKIRHLISPLPDEHAFPPFQRWLDKEAAAAFPLETENKYSRLGFVATIGFLGLLALLFSPGVAARFVDGALLSSASRLMLAAVLLATIGGFSSVVALLLTPEIRAYNRITPFIAFFSLTAIALAIDSLSTSRRRRIAAAAGVLVVGLLDQRTAAVKMNTAHAGIAAEVAALRAFVEPLERRLPAGAMILQLPFRTYLDDLGVARMQPYDHAKLYVVSTSLRWSYPALSNEQVGWQYAAARLGLRELPSQLAAEGFSAIVLDRHGYEDNGAAATAALRAAIGADGVLGETDRYVALDIRALAGSAAAARPRLSTQPVLASTSIGPCGRAVPASFDWIGGTRVPLAATVPLSGADGFKITGWAVDEPNNSPAAAVDLLVDDTAFPTFYGSDRADVARYFGQPTYFATGFLTMIPPHAVSAGAHRISMRVVAASRACYYQGPAVDIVVR